MNEIQSEEIQYGELIKEIEDKIEYLRGCL